ncbi:hypothetical protein [Corallococcus exiguus]|uniref:hypothetical protein n=1 Tax=Corallococcus exiguus TaxID=83462 RepID=UPI003DA21036
MSTNTPAPNNQNDKLLIVLVLVDIALQISTRLWALVRSGLSSDLESLMYATLVVLSVVVLLIVKLWTLMK